MLEQEYTLPCPKHRLTARHWDRELGRGQGRPQMRGHVIRFLILMFVGAALRRKARHISFKVALYGWRSILLDQQRSGCMPAKDRQEPLVDPAPGDEITNIRGE